MNRYIMIRRLRGPAFLLLVGVNALLNQADILSWGKSWPFYLILLGMLLLAERAALAAAGPCSPAPYPGAPYTGTVNPNVAQPPAPETSAIVPANSQDYGMTSEDKDSKGGQS
jgi:hypothetical protein